MKKFLLATGMFFLLSIGMVRAQSVGQLLTQLELDIQKLGTLRTILQDMYKSYTVIDKAYENIKQIAAGNFNLHKAFLDGLLAVTPAVRNYYRIAKIVELELQLVSESTAAYRRWEASGKFSANELGYLSRVYSGLINRGLANIQELTMVLTEGELRMADAERLLAIDRIYTDTGGELASVRNMNNNTALLVLQRQKEAVNISSINSMYGNPY